MEESQPVISINILKDNASQDPETHLSLVQTSKQITFPKSFIPDHFTTYKKNPKDKKYTGLAYRLPNGDIHRENDLPAIVRPNGDQEWWYHGKRHRDHDQPAIVCTDGTQEWYYHGKRHRDHDQPAVVCVDGNQCWYYHGERHRDHDQPAVVCADGTQEWYLYGKKYFPNIN